MAVLAAGWVEAAPRAAAAPAAVPAPARSAVALAERKCGTCHAVPSARSRRSGWVGASVKMHERRVAMSREEWALIREYLGESSATAAR
ncbi:hypothetical protein [Anaeromyxobacter oryzae]|uniref:Cytochrome c domain-containing protein n=1 Tax=Anaeromyxobacter oryzae TaxID=2918170 RepID=A0ABN6N3K4_9BACT|nr:hypothetical protein [Anaeromyxobacter oryzae]BDG06618.1 hypothetical protein AMOR_56140 [Anaeromyxobacter oryzae]